jgi:hypothetical protein
LQSVNRLLALGETEFEEQSVQVEATAAPVAVEYVLVPQSVHMPAPVVFLYFPVAQAEHAAPLRPVAPILQTQELIEVCDMSACPEFNGQSSQAGLVVGKVQNAVKPLFVSESSDLNAILI